MVMILGSDMDKQSLAASYSFIPAEHTSFSIIGSMIKTS